MELNSILSNSTWGKAASDINTNFTTISADLEKVKNATTKNKGYFKNDTLLKQTYKTATVGDIAYVGTTYPYQIWEWNGSAWANSGATGGSESVNLNDYATKEELAELEVNIVDTSSLANCNNDIINQTLDLTTDLEFINDYVTINGYINSKGDIAGGDTIFRVQKYNIEGVGKIALSILDMDAPIAYKYAFYSSDEISSSNLIKLGPTSPGYLTQEISVPMNAKYLAVTNRNTTSVINYVAKCNFSSKGIESLLFYKEAFSISDLQEGFWQKSGDSVVIAEHEEKANYKCVKIHVPKTRDVLLTCNPYGAIVYGAIYTDEGDKYISSEFIGHDKNEIYNRVKLSIPDNAEYIYISGYILNQIKGSQEPFLMAYINDYNSVTNEKLSGYINNGLIWNRVGDNYKSYFVNNAIKFIAFVPFDAYKDHEFTLNALGCYSNSGSATFGATQFDLWVFDKTDMESSGSQKNAARYINTNIADFDYNYCDIIKYTGERGTLYALVDWNIIRGYFSKTSNKWISIYWSISFTDKPTIQKLEKNDPRIKGFIENTEYNDINFGVDGDSITAGNQWSYLVSEKLGFATHHNVAVGSATWACKKQILGGVTYQTQEYDAEDFAGISSGWESTTDPVEIQKRCNNCAKVHVQKFIDEVTKGTYPEPDIFAFAMGTNDSDKTAADGAIATGTNYPSGDMLFTLAGAMKWCIQKIHKTYPNCKIFVLLPIQRYNDGNADNLQKIEIMKEIAKAFSVEVIDMYSNCGISSMLETGTGPYLTDGLHPNSEGRKKMAEYAGSCIRSYLKIS